MLLDVFCLKERVIVVVDNMLEKFAHAPEKGFMLISELEDGHQQVTWHETKEDLLLCAKGNKVIDALEICSCKEIDLADDVETVWSNNLKERNE